MAVSNSDAYQIFKRYFRHPVYKAGSRKYHFDIVGANAQSITDLHRELFRQGSKITLEEIAEFINQKDAERLTPFIHLPLEAVVPGEVIETVVGQPADTVTTFNAIKVNANQYLVWQKESPNMFDVKPKFKKSLKTIDPEAVLAEQEEALFVEGINQRVGIISPSSFFRHIDRFVLNVNYAETSPEDILPLCETLGRLHSQEQVTSNWEAVLEAAAESGVPVYTIFKILEFLGVE